MTVSVFICTYNRGNLIDGTLNALIKRQTRIPDEIVVVNGGGKNDCCEILNKWKKEFPNLRELKTKNINLATSRNYGLPHCKGDLILQTDDDAEPFPNWIERLVEEHQNHPEAGVIGGNVIDASGNGLLFKIADATTFPTSNEVKEVRSVPGVNSSYKRNVIETVGKYDTKMFRGEDVDYNWRAIKLGWKVLSFPDIKVYHHHRATWKGLFNQHHMYGRAYLLVRRKWKDMYCIYPHNFKSLHDFLKLGYFAVVPFVDSYKKCKRVTGILNKLMAYPIMVAIGYNWHRGLFVQYFKERSK